MASFTRAGAMVGALALASSLALTGCGSGGDQEKAAKFVGSTTAPPPGGTSTGGGGGSNAAPPRGPPLTGTPANGAKKQPVSTEISAELPAGGKVTEVILTPAKGAAVTGAVRTDG